MAWHWPSRVCHFQWAHVLCATTPTSLCTFGQTRYYSTPCWANWWLVDACSRYISPAPWRSHEWCLGLPWPRYAYVELHALPVRAARFLGLDKAGTRSQDMHTPTPTHTIKCHDILYDIYIYTITVYIYIYPCVRVAGHRHAHIRWWDRTLEIGPAFYDDRNKLEACKGTTSSLALNWVLTFLDLL